MQKLVIDIKPKSHEETALILGEFEEEKRLFVKSWLMFQVSNFAIGDRRFNELKDFLVNNNIKHSIFRVDARFPTTNCEPV